MTYPQNYQPYPTQPKSEPPSIASTLVITLLFGLFWTVIIISVVLVFMLAAAGAR